MRIVLLCMIGMPWWLDACNSIEPVPPVPPVDTTSHDFTWTVEFLGDGNSSVLSGVALVSDSLAFAVGEIFLRDSTGQFDLTRYNLAVWNGFRWDIRRLRYNGSPPAIKFAHAMSVSDVWLDPWFHWNGQEFVQLPIDPVFYGIGWNRMWGSGNTLYVGGEGGSIAYSSDHGVTWQKLSSGTTLPMRDIWGGLNPQTGEREVLAVSCDPFTSADRRILSITGTTVTAISDNGISTALGGVWFSPGSAYFVTGGRIYRKSRVEEGAWSDALQNQGISIQYMDAVRGTAPNDVFAAGANGDLLHYNGSTWKNFRDQTGLTNGVGEYFALAVKGDLVIAVGEDLGRGVVAIGRRVR
ncbi:MAG: hypothetical protein AB1428_09690 [Bacteroidota bacterium]